ncbi:MAG: glycine cleavage system aminomethyltransferase GcvT [Planctomycetota bacterium]
MADLARTPLHEWHAEHGGRMVDFCGWSMPVQYGSIVEEHQACRTAVGLFDISHMARLLLSGPQAGELLEGVLTRRIADLAPNQVRYALVCNEFGGVLDDVLAYRVEIPQNELLGYGLVVNAANRDTIVAHLQQHGEGKDAKVEDVTSDYGMIAVQGPKAIELLDPVTDCELTSMRYYTASLTPFRFSDGESVECYASRTGYTGEDGCELIVPADHALRVWETLVELAAGVGGRPVGLAARDTLRLEAGMPLYGHELSREINPIQAGLAFAVNLKDRRFVGHDALTAARKDTSQPVRIGLTLEGRRPAREGCPVLRESQVVGHVTSGTFSPTFERPIAMAYVEPSAAAAGEALAVDIRGKQVPATVAPLPFYERGK